MRADSQWKKSRVSCVMSAALPDHTETDSSMMFMAAKPATARHFMSQRAWLRLVGLGALRLERMGAIADPLERADHLAGLERRHRASRPPAAGW